MALLLLHVPTGKLEFGSTRNAGDPVTPLLMEKLKFKVFFRTFDLTLKFAFLSTSFDGNQFLEFKKKNIDARQKTPPPLAPVSRTVRRVPVNESFQSCLSNSFETLNACATLAFKRLALVCYGENTCFTDLR